MMGSMRPNNYGYGTELVPSVILSWERFGEIMKSTAGNTIEQVVILFQVTPKVK